MVETLQSEGSPGLSMRDWDLLIRQARRADLLARLQAQLETAGVYAAVPAAVRGHLEAARRLADKHVRTVRWEIERLYDVLGQAGQPLILLKGAAYVAAGLPPAQGRVFSDLDILVPKAALARVEQRLLIQGWVTEKLHPYDQRYYRRWMHELPPLRHRLRGTVLDVHHNILPETSRYRLDATPLFEAAVPVGEDPRLRILAPADMVLHGAVHLFCDGEFDHGLRDLVDLDGLLTHFGADESFWPGLTDRARALGLTRPLFYAIRHTQRLLGTPVPAASLAMIEQGRPGPVTHPLMDVLLKRALQPNHRSCDRRFSATARWLLYVRGHYLRMPLHWLFPHLVYKALRREEEI